MWCSVIHLHPIPISSAVLCCVVELMHGSVQVVSVLQEAAWLPGGTLDGLKPPSTDIRHLSLSSSDPRPSSDGSSHSMCEINISNGSTAPAILGEQSSATQSSDSPTAGGLHVGMQQAEHMQAAQAVESCAEAHDAARAQDRGLPASCGYAAGSLQAADWTGSSSSAEAAIWKMGEAGSGAYAPALVLEGAAVLTTALSLLAALCR